MKIRYWFAIVAVLTSVYLFLFHPNWPNWLGTPKRTELLSLIKPLDVTPQQTGIDGIDCIYCINLDVRKEKWASMQQKLSKQGMNANRVPAVNGWEVITRDHIKKIQRPCSKMSEIIQRPKELIKGSNFVRTYYRHGAYAMVVSNNGVKKLFDYFAHTPVFFAYDLEFNHIDKIKMYETDKDFVSVDGAISDTCTKPLVNQL